MPTAFDIERARRETPGCTQVLHFNNAGSSLMPQPVLDATVAYLQLEAQMGGYEAAAREQVAIEQSYDAVASLLNCKRDEVAFIENATRAWDMAFYSIPFRAGDRILTSMAEYASNYIAYLQVAQRVGVIIEPVPNDSYGQISIEALRSMIDERVKLISVTHIPTSGGLVNPVEAVGQVAREAGILFLVDACQSIGQLPIDVQKIGCDFLSATGRKYLRGPRGTGFLYVRREVLEQLDPSFLDLHAATWESRDQYRVRDDARRFENWETSYANRLGLTTAINYALQWGLPATWRRVKALAYQLRAQLMMQPGVLVHDRGVTQCGIVTFTVDGLQPVEIQRQLVAQSINVVVSERQSTRLDMEERNLTTMVRASVHYYNTEEEINRFCEQIERIASKQ